MLLVNDTFTSECFLSLWKLFWILCYACTPFHRQNISVFSALFLAGVHFFTIRQSLLFSPILLLFPSMLAKLCWTIPVEAAKKLEVPKSVEMPKEAVRKSVLVESLKHSVIPTTNIDCALERKTLIWRIPGVYKKCQDEWCRGDVEKAAMHSTKKGSGDKLTLQEGPIKITPIKIFGHQWWFNGKEGCGLC